MADCAAINTAIIREEGRIGPEIHAKVVKGTPWIGLTPRDVFPDGMGVEQTTMMFERMLPADDAEVWADVAPSDGITNQCLPPTETILWGQSLATWRLQKIAKNTEDFCLEDLRTAFQLEKVLGNFKKGLSVVSRWVWENRNRNEYIRLARYKVTEAADAGGDFNLTDTAWDASNPPTSRLLVGTLARIYSMMIREGAGEDAMGITSENQPVFGVFTDENTIIDLIRQDPELRSDFRFAYEGQGGKSPLIMPLGSSWSYNGFKYMLDIFPQRFEISGGAYVRVKPFKSAAAASSGTKRDLDPAYVYASYQATPIHVPTVFTQRIPKPFTSPGGGMKFDPVNYMGEFHWKNILDKDCNPDGTIGFYRAVFASASEPVHPEHGYVIMHKNCPAIRTLETSCYS